MAKTEVILTHNIVGLGGESDQVRVAAGYARNYLFPQGFAVPLNGANKRRIESLKQRRAEREAHEFNTMTELAKGVSKLICVIKVKSTLKVRVESLTPISAPVVEAVPAEVKTEKRGKRVEKIEAAEEKPKAVKAEKPVKASKAEKKAKAG